MEARPHVIDNKQVDPKRAVPRELSSRGEANVSTNRLYVSGVREEHNEEAFQAHFGGFGNVTKVCTLFKRPNCSFPCSRWRSSLTNRR